MERRRQQALVLEPLDWQEWVLVELGQLEAVQDDLAAVELFPAQIAFDRLPQEWVAVPAEHMQARWQLGLGLGLPLRDERRRRHVRQASRRRGPLR